MLTQLLPSHGQRSWALNSLSLALLIYKRGLAGRLLTEMPRAQVECSNIILQHLGEWGELDTVGAKDLKGGGQVDHATAPCSWWAADRLTPWLCLFTAGSAGPHRHACVPGYNSYKLRDGKCSPRGALPGRLSLEGSLFSGRLHGDGEGSPTLSLPGHGGSLCFGNLCVVWQLFCLSG